MSSSSGRRRFLVRHPTVVDLGCSCRRTKLASLFSTLRRSKQPKPTPPHEPGHYTAASPRQHHHRQHHPLSSYYPFSTPSAATSAASSWETSRHPSSVSTTTTSPYLDDFPMPAAETTSTAPPPPPASRVGESVAVVKESEDPYHDFRQSMLQMILEKEIYAWEDLQELLSSFLALNSPCHHDVILRAFTEIWAGVYPPNAAAASHGEHGRPPGGHGRSGAAPRRRRRPSRERVAL